MELTMKSLKKIAAIGLCLCLLLGIAAAEEGTGTAAQAGTAGTQTTGMVQTQANRNGRQPQGMPGGRDRNQNLCSFPNHGDAHWSVSDHRG